MKEKVKVSLIVPIYNVEPYLHQCVDSLLAQDEQRIEIILVDDGSPDNCGSICDDYARLDNRIRVIHKPNGGLSSARNAGIAVAKGEYLMFVDSDDWVEPSYCSTALQTAESTGSEIVVFGYTDHFADHTEGNEYKDHETLTSSDALRELMGGKILSFAWNKIYKARLFGNDIRYPEGKNFEDVGTTYKLFARATSISLAKGKTYNYRKRDNSILATRKPKDFIDWFCLETERTAFILCRFPELSSYCWDDCATVVFHCYQNICAAGSKYKEWEQRMRAYLLVHSKEIKKYHRLSPRMRLFYLFPSFYPRIKNLL